MVSELKKIYASLDIGSNYIKGIVAEVTDTSFYILASSTIESDGVVSGIIIDEERLINKVKTIIGELRAQIGIDFTKVILGISSDDVYVSKLYGDTIIANDQSIVTAEDVVRVGKNAALKFRKENYDIINLIPSKVNIDDVLVEEYIGKQATRFGIEYLCFAAPMQQVYSYLVMAEKAGLDIVDICLSAVAEQYEVLNGDEANSNLIINLGFSTTTITLNSHGDLKAVGKYNIGINKVLENLIEKFNMHPVEAIKLIQRNGYEIDNVEDKMVSFEDITGNTVEFSNVEIQSYLNHLILSLLVTIKKESEKYSVDEIDKTYISGGSLEIPGFQVVCDKVFEHKITFYNSKYLGARSPIYSIAFGLIRYGVAKDELRGKLDSSLDYDTQVKFLSPKKRILNLSEDSVIGQLYEFFFDRSDKNV